MDAGNHGNKGWVNQRGRILEGGSGAQIFDFELEGLLVSKHVSLKSVEDVYVGAQVVEVLPESKGDGVVSLLSEE